MTHDPEDRSDSGHDHSHDHSHDCGHGHHHPHDGDHHHWDSKSYVDHWVARDNSRRAERKPFLDRLVVAVPFAPDAEFTALDLGAGAGVVGSTILDKFPRATITLQDFSPHMLAHARRSLELYQSRIRYAECDLREAGWEHAVGGPFDLVVSGIAIHNLHDMAAIAACYQAVKRLLKPPGCFLDYDHFDRVGGVPLHQYTLKVAGFASVEVLWHQFPTALVKAQA